MGLGRYYDAVWPYLLFLTNGSASSHLTTIPLTHLTYADADADAVPGSLDPAVTIKSLSGRAGGV